MPSGNGIIPRQLVKANFAGTYHAGIAEEDMLEYTNTRSEAILIFGELDLINITAAKVITVRVYAKIDNVNYRMVDSKTYTVGTDSHPRFEWYCSQAVKVTMQIDITEGANRSIPTDYTVQKVEA